MPATTKSSEPGGMSSEAVQAKTGKTWAQWVTALDAEGCQKMSHKEIVAVIHEKFGIGAWWQQMVTVGYEQAKGLRDKHQKTDGYSMSATKTINVSAAKAFAAFHDTRTRKKWLAEPITIRKATPAKSLRITWGEGPSSLDVGLYPKGEAKCQVALQHAKLASAKDVTKYKKFWGEKLTALKTLLEG
jgi:hypothetical protein